MTEPNTNKQPSRFRGRSFFVGLQSPDYQLSMAKTDEYVAISGGLSQNQPTERH